ncbi:NAD-dependent epimerase/dehydratase family protein [Orbus mooreae]|uniref:NAD-dependent epimerase/dehydratase family protein n=1 Tax=Orbus mooreae TaxID=3074107 RepID=UPI00370DE2DF
MLKVLLIGSNSIVAQSLSSCLGEQYEFIRVSSSHESDIQIDLEAETYHIKNAHYADIAINFIASFSPDNDEGAYINEKINSLSSFTIMRLIRELKVKRLIHLSSIFCLEHIENEYFGSYGLSKKHGEENFKFLSKLHNIEFIAIRFTQIYDTKGYCSKHQPFLYNMIKQIQKEKKFVLWGSKDVSRNFIHINDVINILKRLITSTVTGTYNALGDKSYSVSEIAAMIFNELNLKHNITFDKDQTNIKSVYIPKENLIDLVIDYNDRIQLSDGIKYIIRGKE